MTFKVYSVHELDEQLDPLRARVSDLEAYHLEPGTLGFTASTYSTNDDGIAATISVERTGGSDGEVSVDYATSDGTATAGEDYTAVANKLTWLDGETGVKTFQIPVADQTDVEQGDETVNLSLSNATNGATLGTSSGVLTIKDTVSSPGSGELEAGVVYPEIRAYSLPSISGGVQVSPRRSMKHQQFTENPKDKKLYIISGDWANETDSHGNSGRQEMYRFDPLTAGWELVHPYCKQDGAQPATPDELGQVWAKGGLFLINGYAFTVPGPCGADPSITRPCWWNPADGSWTQLTKSANWPALPTGGSESVYNVYDPTTDRIIFFEDDKAVYVIPVTSGEIDCEVHTYPARTLYNSMPARVGRFVYMVQEPDQTINDADQTSNLIKWDIDNTGFTQVAPLPKDLWYTHDDGGRVYTQALGDRYILMLKDQRQSYPDKAISKKHLVQIMYLYDTQDGTFTKVNTTQRGINMANCIAAHSSGWVLMMGGHSFGGGWSDRAMWHYFLMDLRAYYGTGEDAAPADWQVYPAGGPKTDYSLTKLHQRIDDSNYAIGWGGAFYDELPDGRKGLVMGLGHASSENNDNSIRLYDPSDDTVHYLQSDTENSDGTLTNDEGIQDRDNHIWLNTPKGLLVYGGDANWDGSEYVGGFFDWETLTWTHRFTGTSGSILDIVKNWDGTNISHFNSAHAWDFDDGHGIVIGGGDGGAHTGMGYLRENTGTGTQPLEMFVTYNNLDGFNTAGIKNCRSSAIFADGYLYLIGGKSAARADGNQAYTSNFGCAFSEKPQTSDLHKWRDLPPLKTILEYPLVIKDPVQKLIIVMFGTEYEADGVTVKNGLQGSKRCFVWNYVAGGPWIDLTSLMEAQGIPRGRMIVGDYMPHTGTIVVRGGTFYNDGANTLSEPLGRIFELSITSP